MEFDWWIAQYLKSGIEHDGIPNMPIGVKRDRILLHQTSAKGNGALYGVQSASIDLNRWQLSEDALKAFIGDEDIHEPLTLEQRIERLEKQVFG